VKIACVGGGTGGHTLPVLAVIKAIEKKDKDAKIIFIGSRFGIESKLVPKMGIKYYGVSTGKFRRYHSSNLLNIIDPTTLFKNIGDFFRFLKGVSESRSILKHEKPDVIFAKGGFVSLPIGLAAKTLKIPVVVHESDVVMGLANRKLSSFADKVCVSFPASNYQDSIESEKIIETGNPIRDDILVGDKDKLKSELGFTDEIKTLLILGGSQGSKFINELVLENIEKILKNWQLIWVTGDKGIDIITYQVENIDEDLRSKVKLYGFLTTEMADVYAAADLVVSRAGSNVLFELAALSKPAILIPFDEAAGSHQLENAKLFSRSGAAHLLRQVDLTPENFIKQIEYFFNNPEELEEMRGAMQKWADIHSAEKVATEIIKTGEKSLEKIRKSKN
jgi:UDP-N-acetylglucosamine--N-acetylmuramyl-(pentapeptide) pyrophosphoryl-undecaprenol N-acetylglucosamine transferase